MDSVRRRSLMAATATVVALAASITIVATTSATGTTLTIVDPAGGERRTVELELDEARLSQRGPFVVAFGEDDETAVLVDARDGTVTELARSGDLNRAFPIQWYRSTGEPLLQVNAAATYVLAPDSDRRFDPPAGTAWLTSTAEVTADAQAFTLSSIGDELLVDLASGDAEVVDGHVVALSDAAVVVSHGDGDVELARRDGSWTRSAPSDLYDWAVIPVAESLVYVTVDGRVMAQALNDSEPVVVGSLPEVTRPRLVSLADPATVLISIDAGSFLVDLSDGSMTAIGQPGDRIPFLAASAAGRADVDWDCIPLVGADHISFVDPATGESAATTPLPGGLDDPEAFELASLLASDGCALAATLGDSWILATADASATGAGAVRWLADDGKSLIVDHDGESGIVTLDDPESFEVVDDHTVFTTAATGSALAW